MPFEFLSHNLQVKDFDQVKMPIDSIELMYGFGVYETLKVRSGKLYFADKHAQRLMESARLIDLNYNFDFQQILTALNNLVEKLKQNDSKISCNLKVLLLGGSEPNLYILPLKALFVDKKMYKQGCQVISFGYERWMPNSKSLNMLPSYVYFSKAKSLGCYDCLYVNKQGVLEEGSRTNLFFIKDKTLFSSPKDRVLDGITRQTVLEVALQNGFNFVEKAIPVNRVMDYDNLFLTSTSTKILPISTIYLAHQYSAEKITTEKLDLNNLENLKLSTPGQNLKDLIKLYNNFLDKEGLDI